MSDSSKAVLMAWRRDSKSASDAPSADGAFHFEVDEAFQLDAVFHRELADEVVDEAVHAEAHRLRFGEAALLHVEDLLGGNLRDAGLVLAGVAGAAHGDRGIRVG